MKIKADNITNLTDARYFAAKEVEWLTFNFTEGVTGYIDPMKARAMFEWVAVPNIVGVFERVTADEAHFYAQSWHLTMIQVGAMTQNEEIQFSTKWYHLGRPTTTYLNAHSPRFRKPMQRLQYHLKD
jgi:phosphoribosylanthranilate isomerase